MSKNELLNSLDSVISNLDRALNDVEKPFEYVRLAERKNAFIEVRNFIMDNLDDTPEVKLEETKPVKKAS